MKILGIDYGRKKIGVAVGDTTIKLTEPLRVLPASNIKDQILKIIRNSRIKKIVVGLPGGKIDEEIKVFGEGLEKQTGVEVEYFDETLSTQDAQKLMIQSGRKRKSRKEKEDAIAAAVMLQLFIESHPF